MKNINTYRVLGLMSGTSLDGLDLAICQFDLLDGKWNYKLLQKTTVEYSDELLDKLSKATELSGLELNILEVELSRFMGEECKKIGQGFKVDFIACHGHTIFHQPEKGLTLQIGDGNILHRITGLPVICDFRTLDVAKGGQGAPLVPLVDKELFSDFNYCLNLGGIANISFDEDDVRKAFDISPCNILLNRIANREGKTYDQDGEMAAKGQIDHQLLEKWNDYNYFKAEGAKSLGFEWVEQNYFDDIDNKDSNILAATAVEHIAMQISKSILSNSTHKTLLITGGGAKNKFLIKRLAHHLDENISITVPEEEIIDFKEALAFAFLGVKRIRGEVNVLRSVTGATSDSCSGVMIGF